MEINIGIYKESLEGLESAHDYHKSFVTLTRQLFSISGIEMDENKIYSMATNIHKFLLDNPQFVVGLINAGKIKAKISK